MSHILYEPLARDKKQTRLLTIKPAPWDEPTKCELHIVDLDGTVPYEALSYVWGDKANPGRIVLHDVEHSVTPNLEAALRHLRYDDRPRQLWVDAVCINQDDLAERAAQVAMMAEIYARAATTVSWLGPAADGSDGAVELVSCLGDWVRENEAALTLAVGSALPEEVAGVETLVDFVDWLGFPLADQDWPAVWRLLERPYWTRAWVIQELAVRGELMRASGVIYCGTRQVGRVQFDYFCYLIQLLLLSRSFTRPDTQEVQEPIRSLQARGHSPGLVMSQTLLACTHGEERSLDALLRITAKFQATDPRDKLYALRSMATDGMTIVQPDYTVSYERLLRQFVLSCIETKKTLKVLLGGRYRENLPGPSWAPDYFHGKLHVGEGLAPIVDNKDNFGAAGSTLASVWMDPQLNVLYSRGVLVGKIGEVIGPMRKPQQRPDPSFQGVTDQAQALGNAKVLEELFSFSRSLPEANREDFWRTLCLDADWTGAKPVFPAPADYGLRQRTTFLEAGIPEDFMPEVDALDRLSAFTQPFITAMDKALLDRTFIVTNDGQMGIGPYLAKPGDVAVVLFGSPFCIILRPVGHQYQFVGDGYVHGVMDGELVEELQPENAQIFEII